MSLKAITWALEQEAPSSAAKFVLFALANFANDQHLAYPHQSSLASATMLSERQVRRLITDLLDKKLIVRVRRGGNGAGRQSDSYLLGLAPNFTQQLEAHGQPDKSSNRTPRPEGQPDKSKAATGQKRGGQPDKLGPPYKKDEPKEPKEPSPTLSDTRRFWDELRPHLSITGRARGKPKEIDERLPRLLKEHGFDALMAAAIAFYTKNPDCIREEGKGQPGLQVICNDGRLVAWINEGVLEKRSRPVTQDDWQKRYDYFERTGRWREDRWGDPPGMATHEGPRKATMNGRHP